MQRGRKRSPKWWDTFGRNKFFIIALLLQLLLVMYMLRSSYKTTTRRAHRDHSAINPHLFFIAIYSDRSADGQRQATRDTWLKSPLPHKASIKYKFIVGMPECMLEGIECDQYTLYMEKKITAENEKYHDILQLPIKEGRTPDYSKMLWSTFQYLKDTLEFQYFLKIQHDTFIRLDKIAEELYRLPPMTQYWSGFVWRAKPPDLPPDTQMPLGWKLTKIPAYTDKSAFILSSDIVYELGETPPTWYFPDEGQTLGFWLLPFNVTPSHDARFQFEDVCHNSMVSRAKVNVEQMKVLYAHSRTNDLCEGFDMSKCPICFECQPEQPHWRTNGIQCDSYGARITGSEDPMLDTGTSRVIGFLPLLSCEKQLLADVQSTNNFVRNGRLMSTDQNLEWELKGSAEIVPKPDGDPQNTCVKLSIRDYDVSSSASYVTQEIVLGAVSSEPLVFSAWSKPQSLEHAGQGDYSLYADFTYADGTRDYAFTVDFAPLVRDWQYNVRIFNPPKPVARINIYCMLRLNRGTAYFDDIFVGHLSHQLCNLKHQGLYYNGFRPATLKSAGDAHYLPNSPIIGGRLPREMTRGIEGGRQGLVDDHIHVDGVSRLDNGGLGENFFLVWTSPVNTFRLRHRRVLESIFFHHPNAHVKMYSNTLPVYFFHLFNSAGYDIQVIKYDLAELAEGLPGANWVSRGSSWEKEEYFVSHLSDFLRLLLLYRFGGIYSDTDSILLRPFELQNVIASEICGSGNNYCKALSDSNLSSQLRYYLPTGFMAFEKEHPLLLQALTYFDSMYDPSVRHCGSIYLSLAYSQLSEGDAKSIKTLPLTAFYPVPEHEIVKQFLKDNPTRWASITKESYAFHFWGMLTVQSMVQKNNSLMWRALNDFSISDQRGSVDLQF